MKDPYELLGVQKSASQDDIRKAWRRLARKYHPDMNPGDDEATEKFKEVTAAYEILDDPQKRAEYDRFGTTGRSTRSNPRPRTGAYSSAFDDFFGDVFGKKSRKRKGEDVVIQCVVDLNDVLNGKKQMMEYSRKIICQDCNGKGGVTAKCKECEGRGVRMIYGQNMNVQISCDKCGGSGESISETCEKCNGYGICGHERVDYEFEIPKGVESGMRFSFSGLGHPCPDGDDGNLYIIVAVKEHDVFTRLRDGGLLCEVPASYTQLVLGDEIEIPTIDDEVLVTFKIPPGTQPNTKFRFKGKGLPKFNNTNTIYRGDQFVQVKLVIPTIVEGRYKELIEELAALEKPKGENDGQTA